MDTAEQSNMWFIKYEVMSQYADLKYDKQSDLFISFEVPTIDDVFDQIESDDFQEYLECEDVINQDALALEIYPESTNFKYVEIKDQYNNVVYPVPE